MPFIDVAHDKYSLFFQENDLASEHLLNVL